MATMYSYDARLTHFSYYRRRHGAFIEIERHVSPLSQYLQHTFWVQRSTGKRTTACTRRADIYQENLLCISYKSRKKIKIQKNHFEKTPVKLLINNCGNSSKIVLIVVFCFDRVTRN